MKDFPEGQEFRNTKCSWLYHNIRQLGNPRSITVHHRTRLQVPAQYAMVVSLVMHLCCWLPSSLWSTRRMVIRSNTYFPLPLPAAWVRTSKCSETGARSFPRSSILSLSTHPNCRGSCPKAVLCTGYPSWPAVSNRTVSIPVSQPTKTPRSLHLDFLFSSPHHRILDRRWLCCRWMLILPAVISKLGDNQQIGFPFGLKQTSRHRFISFIHEMR